MPARQSEVEITLDQLSLKGRLSLPQKATGLVIFAHGSGSSRLSPRNNMVATVLQKAKLATLLFDLLTEAEDAVYKNRFNIPLLAERLQTTTKWTSQQPETKQLPLGFFGASTGAAAALEATAQLGQTVKALVSRGGRPDLASPNALRQVKAPTLCIVGGNDPEVLSLNKQALQLMKAEKELKVIPGAAHLFEEPGALETVAQLATKWFQKYLK